MSAGGAERGSPAEPEQPRTLMDAQLALAGCRPRQDAPRTEWLAYHQRAAAWYAEVAEIDRGHHHEALFMAEQARQHAQEIKTQIPPPLPTGQDEGR